MKTLLIAIVCSLLTMPVFSQIKFEEGLVTFKNGEQINCLIKNYGWRYNPSAIEYKKPGSETILHATSADISAFEIKNILKYKTYTVDVDQSDDALNQLSDSKEPEYKKMEVMLRVVAEGKATLYEYAEKSILKYFIQFDNQNPEPLIHKNFKPDQTSTVEENNTYRNQLQAYFRESKIPLRKFEDLKYGENSLARLVDEYNKTSNSATTLYAETYKKPRVHYRLRPGVSTTSYSVTNNYYPYNTIQFGNKITPRLGFETEVSLPFNNNKWAIMVEPNYVHYVSTVPYELSTAKVNYNAIETNIGPRYYIFLSKHQRLFFDANFFFDLSFGSYYEQKTPASKREFGIGNGKSAGVGFGFTDKMAVQLRWFTKTQVLKTPMQGQLSEKSMKSDGFSLVFSYQLD